MGKGTENFDNIIVCGYPKSGNTWVSRLIAELVDCPVEGFWDEPNNSEIAVEGTDRLSNFRIYKSHHQFHELPDSIKKSNRIICVVRDPRDVILSGARFFKSNKYKFFDRAFSQKFFIKQIYYKFVYSLFHNNQYRLEAMANAVLYGNKVTHHWCRISWQEYLLPFIENDIHMIKYESLKSHGMEESKKALDYLKIKRCDSYIQKSLDNQSFSVKKKAFEANGEKSKSAFMKKGESGGWKNSLRTDILETVNHQFAEIINKLEY